MSEQLPASEPIQVTGVQRQADPAPVLPPPAPVDLRQQQLPLMNQPQGMYDANGRITRSGIEKVLANGGSVLHHEIVAWQPSGLKDPTGKSIDNPVLKSKHITHVDQIPVAADFARTPQDREAARREIEAKQKELDRQLATLDDADTKPAKK